MKKSKISYTYWTTLVDDNGWTHYWKDNGEANRVVSGTKDMLVYANVAGDDLTNWQNNYKADATEVVSLDEAVLKITGDTGLVLPRTSSGRQSVGQFPPEESHTTFISHDWTDETTWYQDATYVSGEELTDSGDQTTYNFANSPVIDAKHGKLFNEDNLTDGSGNDYKLTVYVNGTEVKENLPGQDGSYDADYQNGTITFDSQKSTSDTITADYHYTGTSEWFVKPKDGKVLKLTATEVQFTKNISLEDTMKFWITYVDSNGDTQLVQPPDYYKRMRDFISEADDYAEIPKTTPSSGTWRDPANDMLQYEWTYSSLIAVKSSMNMKIHVKSINDKTHSGDWITTKLNCYSENE